MAISDYILGPRFINGGISTLNLPANVSPFFGMNATSGVTPEVYENFYQKFDMPLQQMDYNSVTLGDGQYLLQPDNSPRFLLQPNVNTNAPMRPPIDMNRFQGVSDMSIIDETTNDEQDQEYIDQVNQSNNKFGGIMDLIMGAVMPGYNFIKGALNKPQSYQQFSPGTSIRNGIVSIDGVNTPYRNFGGDFYDPNTGLNRFDRARNRFNKTGSMKDLFGSSRTGKEFFENRRRIKEQKRLATDRNRRLQKDIQTRMMDGESLSDIGKSTFTGPGMAFEQQSGGVTGKGTANERNYGGR